MSDSNKIIEQDTVFFLAMHDISSQITKSKAYFNLRGFVIRPTLKPLFK